MSADMITITTAQGTWVVRAGGAVIGESDAALRLCEGTLEPVIYFPRADLGMAFMDASETSTHCQHKGQASYFSIQTKSRLLKDAAWSYETPLDGVAEITGHLAFDLEMVTVEQL